MRPSAKASQIALAIMVLPLLLGVMLVLVGAFNGRADMWPFGVVAAAAALALMLGGYGKYPALALALFAWIGLLMVGLSLLPFWLAVGFGVPALMMLPVACMFAGLPWGQRRLARLQARGRGTIEAQWVHVPRSFARAHPFYRLSLGIWVIIAVLVMILAAHVAVGFQMPHAGVWPYGVFIAFTLLALFVKAAVASPMVYLALLGGLPLSIPFLFYWADGVRPNLIYRHRFQRLCQKET